MGGFNAGSSNTTQVQLPNWTPEQQELFKSLMGLVQGEYANWSPYGGEFSTPITSEQQSYLDWTKNTAQQRQAALTQIMSGQLTPDQEALYSREGVEDFYTNAIRNPAVREYESIVEPQIREAYAGPGYWGTSRAGAQAKGAGDLSSQLAAKRAELEYANRQDYGGALDAALNRQAVYGPQAAAIESGILGGAAEMSAAEADEQLMGEYNKWMAQQSANNPYLQMLFALLGLSPYSYGAETDEDEFGIHVMDFGGGGGG
jgi:hypothetical protein